MANDKELIEELLERDKAKPVKKYVPISEDLKDEEWPRCPKCGLFLTAESNFCSRCGQRVDMGTWEL